ncbi:MAG TPA: phosphoglucosamine mutase [Alphaproteobacteria bacterium]|nr:phosphoglucosamine mutase [Alphaproteobacteria bacterium]
MTKKYFGTDGIRGTANSSPMTAGMALQVAMATAHVLRRASGNAMDRVVIGKDTRLSGYMLEQAMASGFVAMGMDVIRTGPIPTPAVARLTTTLRADIGVMISASHNPYQDNGIKLFGADGYKLSDDIEKQIEAMIDQDMEQFLPAPDFIGKATQMDDAPGRYIEYIKRSFPKGQTLDGMKVVVDCAHGAAYKVAPQILWELEADVIAIGNTPNGRNINDGFGATATANLQKRVLEEKADIGIALDGDADRLIVVDEKGNIVDGDQLLGLLALAKRDQGFLKGGIVATVMSNLGLERFFEAQKIDFIRTPVGDRYVVEEMRRSGFNIGGEQSGHIILSDFGTTGDGLLAALQVLCVVFSGGKPASEVCKVFQPLPQLLKNVHYKGATPLEKQEVQSAIKGAEDKLNGSGRLLVRASGTEPLIRVMAEGDDAAMVESVVNDLCDIIGKSAA